VVIAAGYVAFALLAWHYGHSLSSWVIIPVHVVSGVGFGFIVAPTLDLLLGQVPGEEAGNASGLLNTVQQVGLAIGVAVIGVLFFTQIADNYGHGVDKAGPGLRSSLSSLGVSGSEQDATLAAFRVCVHDQAASVDPTVLPAGCTQAVGANPRLAPAFTDAVARADAENYSSAFGTVLFTLAGILLVSGLGFLVLPKHSRPLHLSAEDTELDAVTV
jgi:hypothetical protein